MDKGMRIGITIGCFAVLVILAIGFYSASTTGYFFKELFSSKGLISNTSISATVCGNGRCEKGETLTNCRFDCGSSAGASGTALVYLDRVLLSFSNGSGLYQVDQDKSVDFYTSNNATSTIHGADAIKLVANGFGSGRGFRALNLAGEDSTRVEQFDTFYVYLKERIDGLKPGVLVFYEDPDTGRAYSLDLDDDGVLADRSGGLRFNSDSGDVITNGESLAIARLTAPGEDRKVYVSLQAFDPAKPIVTIRIEGSNPKETIQYISYFN